MDNMNLLNSSIVSSSPVSYHIGAGTKLLCLDCHGTRLIAAGQQNFQLLSIDKVDQTEQFSEIFDFRNGLRTSRNLMPPTDIGWSPTEENYFASANTTGSLSIWDVNQLTTVGQYLVHNGTINRLQFHPTNPKQVLTASQDTYAKLIDFRVYNANKVVTLFRHGSEDGFRDIHFHPTNPTLFASALNDQTIVPIWDTRKNESPVITLSTADRTQCLAWNPIETNWLATGGRDRTIRVWNTLDPNGRQKPLFKVQSFGAVAKLGWRPTCRYHIACSTPTVDPRIHLWDIRRTYLPQASFCHHQNSIGDFVWRPNSDSLISVGRDERLVLAHTSSAIKTEQFVSPFSINVTSKGDVFTVMPNIDDDYVRALYATQHVPITSTSVKKHFSQEVMSTFTKWNQTINGKSMVKIFTHSSSDNLVEQFHQIARGWTFGNSEKSSVALAKICDINGTVAEQLKRPDLKATWQVIKMLYADYDGLQNYRGRSSRHTPSSNKNHPMSDSLSGHRHYHHHFHQHHHHHHQGGLGKPVNNDLQPQQHAFESIEENAGRKRGKSQEQAMQSNGQMEIIDDADTYIVRDVLSDDIIFITPEDALNTNNMYDISYDNELDIDVMHERMTMINTVLPVMINGTSDTNGTSIDRFPQYPDVMMVDEDDYGPTVDGDDIDGEMQASTQSTLPDGSDKFFTIDESYCPTMQNHPLNFDDVIRKTILYYIENNELQVAVHLLLALYPKLGEHKIIDLFNRAHFEWVIMYIELLQKMRLFVKAKQVTKHCLEKERILLNYDPHDFDGSIILAAQSPMIKRYPSTTASAPVSSSNPSNAPPPMKDFMCSICRIPCRGIFSFCGVCFHGGHIDHIRTWFYNHDECPYGCGHRCKVVDIRQRRSRDLSQRISMKTSFVLQ